MYAIAFDLDTAELQKLYGTASWNNAYTDIKSELQQHGFNRQQGSVYFGDDTVNAVSCVMASQSLSRKYTWFKPCVRDMRMLKIEEFNDLVPAL